MCTISGRTASYFTNILRKFEESLCLVKSDIFVNMRHSGIETVQSLVKACQLIFWGGGCNGIWLFVWNNSPIGFCLRFNNRRSCMYISNSKFAKSAGNLLKFLINLCKIIILCCRPSGSSWSRKIAKYWFFSEPFGNLYWRCKLLQALSI